MPVQFRQIIARAGTEAKYVSLRSRPSFDLAPTDLDALVRLDMGPHVQVVLGGEALHPVDVALHDVGQHDRHGVSTRSTSRLSTR